VLKARTVVLNPPVRLGAVYLRFGAVTFYVLSARNRYNGSNEPEFGQRNPDSVFRRPASL
jgi:hypothetical protein